MSLPIRTVLTAGCLLLAASAVSAAPISGQLAFSLQDQQIYSLGDDMFQDTLAGYTNENGTLALGTVLSPAPLGIDLGDYGARVSASASVDVGASAKVRNVAQGTIDVSLPLNVDLTFPETVLPGQTFTVSSSFVFDNSAGFQSTVDQAEVDLGFRAKATFEDFSVDLCVVICILNDDDLGFPSGGVDEFIELFTFDKDSIAVRPILPLDGVVSLVEDVAGLLNIDIAPTTPLPLPFGVTIAADGSIVIPDGGTGFSINPTQDVLANPADALLDYVVAELTGNEGHMRAPDLSQAGGLQDPATGVLSGTVTEVFTHLDYDATPRVTPPLPPLGIRSPNVGGAFIEANIFDASFRASMIAQQSLTVTPGIPMVTLDAGPLGVHEFPLGESIDLTVPLDLDPAGFDIAPTFSLEGGALSNQTILSSSSAYDITFLGLEATFPGFTIPAQGGLTIPGQPGFCLIPNPFGGCIVSIPPTDPIVIIPATNPITLGAFEFKEAVFQDTVGDILTDTVTTLCDLPIVSGVCNSGWLSGPGSVLSEQLNATALLDQEVSQEFMDSISLAFGPQSLAAFHVDVAAEPPPGATPQNPLLPSDGTNGDGFQFTFDPFQTGLVFVDPIFSTGYEYEVLSGPLFSSVVLPVLPFNSEYELHLFDSTIGEFVLAQMLSAGLEHFFETGGVDVFRILAIDPRNMLDPADPLAFVTGLSFTSGDTVSMTMTPISSSVPEPAPLILMGLGVLAICAFGAGLRAGEG